MARWVKNGGKIMYQAYLFGENEDLKKAFLAGCYEIMDVLAHTSPEGYGAVLSRRDPDWILTLCDAEQRRKQHEQEEVAAAILRHYNVDRKTFRGMLLDCYGVNNSGEKIGPDGRPEGKAEYQYPHRFYMGDRGEELTHSEYDALPEERQYQYDLLFRIPLARKTGQGVKWISQYDGAVIKKLLEQILPTEPPKVLALYCEALKGTGTIGVLDDYRGELESFFAEYEAASNFYDFLTKASGSGESESE